MTRQPTLGRIIMTSRLLFFALIFLGVTASPVARATSIDQMRSTCNLGQDPTPDGSMPTSVAGVTLASPREAKCVIERVKDIVIIAPMRDVEQLPGAVPIISLATSADSHDADAKFTPAVSRLTGGDLARPILVYCHHTSCGFSYNAALHLRRLGYTNILWLREGLKGWEDAGYPLATFAQVQAPLDEPAYFMWTAAQAGYSMECFGDKDEKGCDLKLALGQKAMVDPALAGKDREYVFSEVMNTAAVRAENLREKGKTREGYEAIRAAYADLLDYADGGAKVGTLSGNAKVLREYALANFEEGRTGDAAQFLAQARKDGGARYRQLAGFAKDSDDRKSVQSAMVGMEHLERDVADYAAKKALSLYAAGRADEAKTWRRLTDDAVDHAILWIDRNGKEGVGHMMDLQPLFRVSEIKTVQASVAKAAGDKAAAAKGYNIASNAICGIAKPDAVQAIINHRQPDDDDWLFASKCVEAQFSYLETSGTIEKWAKEKAKRDYDLYMSLLKD